MYINEGTLFWQATTAILSHYHCNIIMLSPTLHASTRIFLPNSRVYLMVFLLNAISASDTGIRVIALYTRLFVVRKHAVRF